MNTTKNTTARRAAAVAGASAAALALWTLAGPVLGIDLTVGPGEHIGAGAVVASSLIAGLAAWALLAVLERLLSRPARGWTITALSVLALSMNGPLRSAADGPGMAVLLGMHLVVGVVLILGLLRASACPRPQDRC